MKSLHHIVPALLIASTFATPSHAGTSLGGPMSIDAAFLKTENIPSPGRLVRAYRITDQEGEHVLVMSRKEGPSPQNPDAGRVERIDLTAGFYTRINKGNWTEEWTIRDNSDCPSLDLSAQFYSKYVTFTDLNKDGRVEVTVPYRMFCGGAVDSYLVKVILREGATKLAIRGQSRVSYSGEYVFGGEHDHDKLLKSPAFAAYKAHMDKVWKQVSDDRR
jgi:hypothetical protein